jgi:hypothetical protein
MSTIQNPASPQAAAQTIAAGRPKYRFTFPESVRRWASDPQSIVMKELTLAEEQMANTVANGFGYKMTLECLKHTIIEVNGQPLTWDGAAKETFLEGCSPPVRDLLIQAYVRLHQTKEDAREDFFASMTTAI